MVDYNTCRETKTGNILTPKARMSYPNLLEARAMEGAEPKYSVSLLVPPSADLTLLKQAALKCAKEKWGENMPKSLKSPFLDAEEKGEGKEGYEAGWALLRPSTKQKPGVVDARGANITDEGDIYPGRWCVASLRPFAYDVNGNKGVSFGLQNVQVLDHDDPIGGRSRPDDDFEYEEGVDGTADDVFGGSESESESEAPKNDLDDEIPF